MKLNDITNNIKWIKPGTSEEFDEVEFQLQEDINQHFLPTWTKHMLMIMSDVQTFPQCNALGTVKNVTPELQQSIGNTGDSWEDSHWKPESVDRVPKLFTQGTVTMPTLLTHGNKMWLLGGHHRLTYNSQVLKQNTPCWCIEYSDAVQNT